MAPLLHGLLQSNDKELAVIGTYYRICLQVRSLKALPSPKGRGRER